MKIVITVIILSVLFLGNSCKEAERVCANSWDRGTKEFKQCVQAFIDWEIRTREKP